MYKGKYYWSGERLKPKCSYRKLVSFFSSNSNILTSNKNVLIQYFSVRINISLWKEKKFSDDHSGKSMEVFTIKLKTGSEKLLFCVSQEIWGVAGHKCLSGMRNDRIQRAQQCSGRLGLFAGLHMATVDNTLYCSPKKAIPISETKTYPIARTDVVASQ